MAAKSDYYDTLDISKDASAAEIKSAYRKKALEWHPDKHKDNKDGAEQKFKEVNEAYQILSDPQKRQAYDQFGHQAFRPGGGAPGAQPGGFPGASSGQHGPFTYTYSSTGGAPGGFDFGDPFEIFEQFFGGGNPFRRGPAKPRYSIDVSFMDAAKGVDKQVNIDDKTKTIKIPAGVDDGTRIDFNDFTLSINVLPDTIFQRDGYDVIANVDIPISTAVLGDTIKVPTIDGQIKVKVRPGTQPGSLIRLRGKGIPHVRGRGRGDEYIRLRVTIPEKLDSASKNLIKKLKGKGL